MMKLERRPGYYLPLVLTLAAVVFIISTAILSLAFSNFKVVKKQSQSTSALNVAEAGINYYLWHLAHAPLDYCDGNACSGSGPFGPYSHEYKDTNGTVVGSYSITIFPPDPGGNTVTVRSVGQTQTGENRTILATLGVPSFAQYAFVTNSEVWFGEDEVTSGLVHSNNGVHFDGTAADVISASVETFTPSSCFGGNGSTQNGVWGDGGPTTYWNFPVPQVDFNQITSDLSTIQQAAAEDGMLLPTLVNAQGQKTHSGYALQFNASGDVTVGRVTASRDSGKTGGSCVNHSRADSLIQSVIWESTPRTLPSNGIIFVADNLWVWGTITDRLTVASGRLPDTSSTNTSVYLQSDITYSAKDGTVALGILSQSDIRLNSASEDDLNIDAYLMSQKGKVFRPLYAGNIRDTISVYGGIASYSWWTWNWADTTGTISSGYQNTSQTYDTYLALNPPPLFPKSGSHAILSWKEEPIL